MLIYKGNEYKIAMAVHIANQLIKHNYLYAFLQEYLDDRGIDNYTMPESSIDFNMIMELRLLDEKPTRKCEVVKGGKFTWRFTGTLAKHSKNKTTLSKYKTRSLTGIVGTLIHEYVHHCDFVDGEEYVYGHGEDGYKPETMPYYLGLKASMLTREIEKMIEAKDYIDIYNYLKSEHE